MRGIVFGGLMLGGLAVADFWFSSRLLAQVYASSAQFSGTVATETESVEIVEKALNSRYMQWGAVGVMLGLFVWLITRHLPNQERSRETERKVEREAYAAERRQDRDVFLSSLEKRDHFYLETLAEIRRSVESHAAHHQESKERLTAAVNTLTSEVKARS